MKGRMALKLGVRRRSDERRSQECIQNIQGVVTEVGEREAVGVGLVQRKIKMKAALRGKSET